MDIIFLEFSKAFDMVPRERLLAKLESKGISGTVLSWLREWLIGRKQRVVIGEEKSDWEDVDSGVPQGSVMGPCAFDVFIDDLEEEITRIDPEIILLKFADDSKLARDVSSEDNRRKLQDALDKLCKWASKWGMSFNVKKCKVMHIGHANKKGDYTIGADPWEDHRGKRRWSACDRRPETFKPLCKGCQHGYERSAADPEKLHLPGQIHIC